MRAFIVGAALLCACGKSGGDDSETTQPTAPEATPAPAPDLTRRTATAAAAEVIELGVVEPEGKPVSLGTTPELALTPDGRPVIAYRWSGTDVIQQWKDGAWTAVDPPGLHCVTSQVRDLSAAVAGDGALHLASLTGKGSLCVTRRGAEGWGDLGETFGGEDPYGTAPRLVLTPDGPVVLRIDAKSDHEQVYPWRWDGTTWQALPPAGDAGPAALVSSFAATATPDGLALMWIGQVRGQVHVVVHVARLATKTGRWTALPSPGYSMQDWQVPSIAMTGDGALAVSYKEGARAEARRLDPGAKTWALLAKDFLPGPLAAGPGMTVVRVEEPRDKPMQLLRHDGTQWAPLGAPIGGDVKWTMTEDVAVGPDGSVFVLWKGGPAHDDNKLRVTQVKPK